MNLWFLIWACMGVCSQVSAAESEVNSLWQEEHDMRALLKELGLQIAHQRELLTSLDTDATARLKSPRCEVSQSDW